MTIGISISKAPPPHRSGSRADRSIHAFLARGLNQRCICGCGERAKVVGFVHPPKERFPNLWSTIHWRPYAEACLAQDVAAVDLRVALKKPL